MTLEQALTAHDPGTWRTRQAVVFDWYDGPRSGICALATPECEFAFGCLDERCNPEGCDDRIFRLGELPRGTVERLVSFLKDLGGPAVPIWIPLWTFATGDRKAHADAMVNEILGSARLTNLVVSSQDCETFRNCRLFDEFPPHIDWFDHLGMSGD